MRVSGPGINMDQQAFNDFLTNREGRSKQAHLYCKVYTITQLIFKDIGDNDGFANNNGALAIPVLPAVPPWC